MGLFIAIPFVLVSFIMGFWAKKNPSEKNFCRFILLSLTIACLTESIFTQQVSIIQSSFIGALSFAYIANLIKNKYLAKLIELSALAILLLAGFIQGVEIIHLAASALLIILSYYVLNSYKNNVVVALMQIIPIGLSGLYLKQDFMPFIITFMTLFAIVRYFIENKQFKMPKFFIQSYLAILLMLINSFQTTEFTINFIILLAGSAFMLLSYAVQELVKHQHSVIDRLIYQAKLEFVLYIKLFVFNISAIVIGFLVKQDYISIYFIPAYIVLILGFGYAKLWYQENETKF